MIKTKWQELMNHFKIVNDFGMYEKLINAYSEEHRHYHTLDHINHIFKIWNKCEVSAHKPKELELAIFFHDFIYNTSSTQNELMSAEVAKDFLSKNPIDKRSVNRVYSLILSTKHSYSLNEVDQKLLSDLDLSILGEESRTFDLYESNIRKEFQSVPKPIYIRERIKLLKKFLDKNFIYHNEHFKIKYESMARTNIQRSINHLQNQQ